MSYVYKYVNMWKKGVVWWVGSCSSTVSIRVYGSGGPGIDTGLLPSFLSPPFFSGRKFSKYEKVPDHAIATALRVL